MENLKNAPGPGQPGAAPGWDPFTGKRKFRSAREAWLVYGRYRFSFSERKFYDYVGDGKLCPPRDDKSFYVEDIEIFAQSQGWPRTSFFVRGAQQGGQGEAPDYSTEIGVKIQQAKLRKAEVEAKEAEMEFDKKLKALIPRSDYEKRMAAAAAVVSNGLEIMVYDSVRAIIHLCGGSPEKEDSLREYLLEKVRDNLHGFSKNTMYAVYLEDSGANSDWEDEAAAYATLATVGEQLALGDEEVAE